MENYKELLINERFFRINRMTATVGSRVLNVLLSVAANAVSQSTREETQHGREELEKLTPEEQANTMIGSLWVLAGGELSEESYNQLQRHCLLVCALRVTPDADPIPILMNNGRWAAKELESDIVTVDKLISEALQFNLAPFFIASASKPTAEAAAPTLPPPHTPRATGMFPGQ
jgi:hypothetical protein